MDRLDGLEAFVAVAEAGSFSAAALRLGLSRALVSKRVAALEQELGARLLNRTTRRLSLTGPGAEILMRGQRILLEFEAARNEVSSLQGEATGRLKVAAPMSFGIRHLGSVVAEFARAYPRLVIELQLNDRFVDLVEEGFDLAIRVGHLPDSTLVARRLGEVERFFCAAPAYLEQRGPPTRPRDLEHHRGLHYTNAQASRWRLRDGESDVAVDVPVALAADNGDLLMAAAIAGMGVVHLPAFICAEAVADGRLVRILQGFEGPAIPISAIWPSGRLLAAKVRLFVDTLVRSCGQPPYWQLDGGAANAA